MLQDVAAAACILNATMYSTLEESYQRQLCTEGYYGPACSLCVRAGPQRYGRAGFLQCKACPNRARVIGAYVGCTVLVLLWLLFIIHVTLAENEEVAAGSTDPGHTTQLIRVSEDTFIIIFTLKSLGPKDYQYHNSEVLKNC